MKRDMGVVRQFLLAIEAVPSGVQFDISRDEYRGQFPELNNLEVREYFILIEQAGFLHGASSSKGGFWCRGLSWEGHDFLAAIRSDTVWDKMKDKVYELGATVPLSIIRELGLKYGREYFGLS